MKIAWVTHRDYDAQGGAESADSQMMARRPEGVDIMLVRPGGVSDDLKKFDRVVISGLLNLSSREQNVLADLAPAIWVHDMATTGHWLYEKARPLICLTPLHYEWECETTPALERVPVLLNPGWMDTSAVYGDQIKIEQALWAHVPYEHKGLDLATHWANKMKIPLTTMSYRSHKEVIRAMETHRYFVLLSKIKDPGPRSIIEAQLANCVLVTNENVGVWEEDRDDLLERINRADKEFWEAVCEL